MPIKSKTPYLCRITGSTSWWFQRAVPKDVQQVIGKKTWKTNVGPLLPEARRRVLELLADTDTQITQARGLLDPHRHEKQRAEALLWVRGRTDKEIKETPWVLESGVDHSLLEEQQALQPVQLKTGENLLDLSTALKRPSPQTRLAWENVLEMFLSHAREAHPTLCTNEQAKSFRDHCLKMVSPQTTRNRISLLSGMWNLMVAEGWCQENIWSGVLKYLKIPTRQKDEIDISVPDQRVTGLPEDQQLLYQLLRWTGMRLAEGAGLRYEDIREGVINLVPHDTRPLKTTFSRREIPIHQRLDPHLSSLKGSGLIFPHFYSKLNERWRVNTSWTNRIGLKPHGLRDYVTQSMRQADVNERTIGAVLGHAPSNMTGTYGTVTMEAKVKAVETIQ